VAQKLRFHPLALVGVLLIIGGIAALIHPQIMMPAQTKEVAIGPNKAIITTHRVLEFPTAFSVVLIFVGAAQIYLLRKREPTVVRRRK
jgi:hypothetical protein